MLNYPLMSNNILKEDIVSLINFLEHTNRFTNGPKVREFEKVWSEWLGVKHSVFVHSGSAANFMTMAGIREIYGEGEIIVPAVTWESDIASIIRAGLTPVIVDIDFKNLAMDTEAVAAYITEKTKAVFLSHILGFNGLSDKLIRILQEKKIMLVEDVCESHGAVFANEKKEAKKCGSVGFASNFSFYYAHHMSTIEGGMICTNDDKFYQYMRMFRSHGMLREADDLNFRKEWRETYPRLKEEFLFAVPGFNMRSTELNAVIGLNQIKRLDKNIEKRRQNYQVFIEHLNPERYYTDFDNKGNSNYAFVVLLRNPDEELFCNIVKILSEENVEFRRGTAGGGNQVRQPYVQNYVQGVSPEKFPRAEHIHEYGLYIGNYPDLEEEKILAVCQLLNTV